MNTRTTMLGLAGVLAVFAAIGSVRAEDVPKHFVSEEMCASRTCTCEDLPMMEAFRKSQNMARDAWKTVKADIGKAGGPTSGKAAVALFQSRFKGDQCILNRFEMCTGYDADMNKPDKVAGVSPTGDAKIDPCFCDAFCKDIVQSTIAHERMHVPTIIAGTVAKGDYIVGCGLGLLPDKLCKAIEPTTLSDSEILSYGAGISWLDASIMKLSNMDPENPEIGCTWEPLGMCMKTARAPSPPPTGFFARVTLLLKRIFLGADAAESGEAYAALDAAR